MTFLARRPNALAELIKRRMQEENLSLQEVADRGGMPKPTLASLGRGPLKQSPEDKTITALARGLSVPPATVQQAIAEALGVARQEIDDPAVREVLDMMEGMSADERKMSHGLVATVYRSTQAG